MSPVSRRVSASALAVLLAVGSVLALGVGAASAQPSAITVVSGSVAQTTSGGTLTLTQTTDVAIISASVSADVTAGETLRIVQPSATSVLVIRDLGAAASTFAGTVVSNGSVVLINPLGWSFAATASVQIGGDLIVTSGDATNAQFIDGGVVNFTIPDVSGPIQIGTGATVVSQGSFSLLSSSVSSAGTTGSEESRYSALPYRSFGWDPQNRNYWSFGDPIPGAIRSFTGTQFGVGKLYIPGFGSTVLSGDSVATTALTGEEYFTEADVNGEPIDSPTGFRLAAVGPQGESTSPGARVLLGDPVAVSANVVSASIQGFDAVPSNSFVRVQDGEFGGRFAADLLVVGCAVDQASGMFDPYFQLSSPEIDGADFLPDGFDPSIPNQAPITVPGYGTVTLNQQVASQYEGHDLLTMTALHLVTEQGDEVTVGEVSCGVPQPVGPALAATGSTVPSGAVGIAAVVILAGALLIYRRRVVH